MYGLDIKDLNIELKYVEHLNRSRKLEGTLDMFTIPLDSESDTNLSGFVCITKTPNGYLIETYCGAQETSERLMIMSLCIDSIFKSITGEHIDDPR